MCLVNYHNLSTHRCLALNKCSITLGEERTEGTLHRLGPEGPGRVKGAGQRPPLRNLGPQQRTDPFGPLTGIWETTSCKV